MNNSNPAFAVAFSQWNMVLATVMPLFVALVIQAHWPKPVKAAVALFANLGASLVALYLQGKLTDFNFVFGTLGLILQTGTYFHIFWGPVGAAKALEMWTTFNKTLSSSDSSPTQ